MSRKQQYPVTPAVRFLRSMKIDFVPRLYDYEERGGTSRASRELAFPEHAVIKTLIMETDRRDPLIVIMHGDREVSTKELARVIGAKRVAPCAPGTANRHSGYVIGGTSPFGTKRAMPIYAEASIFELERVCINAGGRGFLVELNPRDLLKELDIVTVSVGVSRSA